MAFPEPTIGKAELATILGCSARTVQERCAAGRWPCTMPAGSLRFTEEHVRYIVALDEKRPTEKTDRVDASKAVVQQSRTRRRKSVEAATSSGGTLVTPLRSRPAPRLATP